VIALCTKTEFTPGHELAMAQRAAETIGAECIVIQMSLPDESKKRQGLPEVICGAGKTPEQIVGICSALLQSSMEHILSRTWMMTKHMYCKMN